VYAANKLRQARAIFRSADALPPEITQVLLLPAPCDGGLPNGSGSLLVKALGPQEFDEQRYAILVLRAIIAVDNHRQRQSRERLADFVRRVVEAGPRDGPRKLA
jgi:hypothetical protein